MSDERDDLDERLRQLAQSYNAPPPTVPRESMWARIEAERRSRRERAAVPPPTRWRWTRPALAIAATLLLGVLLGRWSMREGATPTSTTPQVAASAPGVDSLPRAYQVATIQHLGQAEALLTTFRAEARSGEVTAEIRPWAQELLTSTRLLLDSPAAADPQVGPLLLRLELVLAQIVQLPSPRDTQELELIDDALEASDVLTQLRTAVPPGPVRQASGD